MTYLVFQVPDEFRDRVTLVPLDPRDESLGGYSRPISEGSALNAIVCPGGLLDQLDTVEIHELQRNHVPAARQKAVSSASRTRPVRLPEAAPTSAILMNEIQREFDAAVEDELWQQFEHDPYVEIGGEG